MIRKYHFNQLIMHYLLHIFPVNHQESGPTEAQGYFRLIDDVDTNSEFSL